MVAALKKHGKYKNVSIKNGTKLKSTKLCRLCFVSIFIKSSKKWRKVKKNIASIQTNNGVP